MKNKIKKKWNLRILIYISIVVFLLVCFLIGINFNNYFINAKIIGGELSNVNDVWIPRENARIWRSVAMSSDGSRQTAVVDNGRIYVSTDYGSTWTPKENARIWRSVAMSSDGSRQTAVSNGGQIYVSTNYGSTWTPKESTRSWYSVAMSSDGSRQTAVVLSGRIYISTDYGSTWTPKESTRSWYSVAMSSDGSRQTAVEHWGRIYVSSDYGSTWTPKENIRYWRSVSMSSDGSRQTAVYSTGTGSGMYISSDYGFTWTLKEIAGGNWYSVAMSSDGSRQTAVSNGGQIYVSTNYGSTWTPKESTRSWYSVAMSSDGSRQTAVEINGRIYVSGSPIGRFIVLLSANPSSGSPPLSVSLTATVIGDTSGSLSYTFYCNRNDSGTNIIIPYDARFENVLETVKTATNLCSYNLGTYTSKVIVENNNILDENRIGISVTPACGNHNCDTNLGENCLNCASDCFCSGANQICNISAPSRYLDSKGCICVTQWNCNEWSLCNAGIETRNCIDMNNCSTDYNKPIEIRGCDRQGNCLIEDTNNNNKLDDNEVLLAINRWVNNR